MPYHVDQFFRGHALESVTVGSGLQGAPDIDIAFESCDGNDTGIVEFGEDRDHRVDAAHVGQSDIHQSDVGPKLTELLQRSGAGCGFTGQRHIRLAVDHGGEALAEQRVVVNDQDANGPIHSAISQYDWLCVRRAVQAGSKAKRPGTHNSTSVPRASLLMMRRCAPIRSALSRIPCMPQRRRLQSIFLSSMPQPLSRTEMRSSAGLYSMAASMSSARECL